MEKNLNEMRKLMGTLPDDKPEFKTEFHKGVTGMSVKLIDYSVNPYKAMYTLATSCWGKKIDKWADTLPKHRFEVVKAVLERVALPLAYESAQFTFACENIPRWSFDQIVRARLGFVASSRGTRDNCHLDAGFFVHDDIYEDKELREEFMKAALQCKEVYKKIVEKGKNNWQSARSIFPISNTHAFSFSINFAALQSMISKRAKFCEADATVAFAWLVRKEIENKFPLLANYLIPACDFTNKCQYNKTYYLSNCFGCLFKPCGRNKCDSENSDYSSINTVCSDREKIMEQLGISIPTSDETRKKLKHISYDLLSPKDKKLFEEE